jgi:deazaflavin-dependent oxidoreductase (nitroreductase family)
MVHDMNSPRPITEAQFRLLKPLARWMSWWHVLFYRLSGGSLGRRFNGSDVCLVHMKGAKSGRDLQLPLMYVPFEDGVILVASFAGGPRHPAWYYNLVAYPDIAVEWNGQRKLLTATRASPEEKAEVWALCCRNYQDFDLYQNRTQRDIPVFICRPKPSHTPNP